MRGTLRREAERSRGPDREPSRGRAHADGALWKLPQASAFGDDPILSNTILFIEELRALGVAGDLIARCAERRALRRGRGGAPRMRGSYELLFVAYVDLGFTSVEAFHAKLTNELLRVCGFSDFWPSRSLLSLRFEELEKDGDAFREVKNVLVRAGVAAEPRLAEIVMLDSTLVRSAHGLQWDGRDDPE